MKCTQIFMFLIFLLSSLQSFSTTRVALVLDRAGKEDRSFNAAAYLGATRAQKELGIELKHVEASDLAAFDANGRC